MNESLSNPVLASPEAPKRSRRGATLGVAAGLLAGGAIGLVATVPSLTSAALDDTTPATDGVAALQDSTDPTDDAPADGATDEARQPGDRMRTALQPLVDDGTIDSVQADAVAEHLVENFAGRRGGRGHGGLDGHGRNNTVVADLLGIDAATLRAELEAGKSVADIAEENGVDVQTVIDGLIADAQSHIDLAIDHGVDEEEAAERLAKVTERIEEGVYRTRPTDG